VRRIVLDTNIIVSSFFGNSYPRQIIRELVLPRKVKMLISFEVASEYRAVLLYKKFKKHSWFEAESKQTIKNLIEISEIHIVKRKIEILSDPTDNKFIELTAASHTDFLITGNSKHFPYGKFESAEIISPRDYWKTYWN